MIVETYSTGTMDPWGRGGGRRSGNEATPVRGCTGRILPLIRRARSQRVCPRPSSPGATRTLPRFWPRSNQRSSPTQLLCISSRPPSRPETRAAGPRLGLRAGPERKRAGPEQGRGPSARVERKVSLRDDRFRARERSCRRESPRLGPRRGPGPQEPPERGASRHGAGAGGVGERDVLKLDPRRPHFLDLRNLLRPLPRPDRAPAVDVDARLLAYVPPSRLHGRRRPPQPLVPLRPAARADGQEAGPQRR